jgi:uncharacterized protein YhfF
VRRLPNKAFQGVADGELVARASPSLWRPLLNAGTLDGRGTVLATNVERYWEQFLRSMPTGTERPTRYLEAFAFGFTAADAKQIAQLVLAGTKIATGSVLRAREADGKPLPMPGDLSIVTLGGDDPVCVIETTDARIIPFDEVTADYAWDGGEGDRSQASWREMYWKYIERECERLALEPDAKTPLLMERFRVVYAEPMNGSELGKLR